MAAAEPHQPEPRPPTEEGVPQESRGVHTQRGDLRHLTPNSGELFTILSILSIC